MSALTRRTLLLGLLAAAAAHAEDATAPKLEPGDETALPRPIPRWLLQASNGRTLMSEDLSGRFQLLSFGYVSCPDVCPTTLLQMKEVLAGLGARAARLQPLFVSVDPERDTLAVLREYTAAFDQRILGVTGPPELLNRAARAFGVRYEKFREPGASANVYTVDHTVGMFLVGPDGQLLTRFAHGADVAGIVGRIGRWMDAAER